MMESRRVGMADEADSKSVVGNHVWVQVPSPAVIDVDLIVLRNYKVFSFVANHERKQVVIHECDKE